MSHRCFLLCCLLAANVAYAQTNVLLDLEYGKQEGHSLKLDIYKPNSFHGKCPTVVFVHGGGWKNGDKKSAKKTASWLTEHGFIVASINYRLTDVAGWPAQINDCYLAVRWLRDNSEKHGIDPENIGCWGTSAGGHLVALMGTRDYPGEESTPSKVKAVCDWFGPSDLITMPPNNVSENRTIEEVAASNGAKLLRATVREVPDLARDASALHQVSSDDASFLIMHGDADPSVPLDQSSRLHSALVAANVPSQLSIIKGAGHGGKLFQSDNAKHTVLQFFQRTLMRTWPHGSGPNSNFGVRQSAAPTAWSVIKNQNIRWKKTLPETGQSTITVWNDRIFFTTLEEVHQDESLGKNIVAWCCNAETGETIWTREVSGDYPLRLSGCFSDSSSPSPVANGKLVCFFNSSGRITCFDFDGKRLWTRDTMAAGRSQPCLVDNCVVFIRQSYMPDDHGHFTHEHKDAPRDKWTQLQAVDIETGDIKWTSECGSNMGSVNLLQSLKDGRRVMIVGRGGGHSPPEKPEGISMINAVNGTTAWTLPLDGFMSTMTFNIVNDQVLVFHDDEHLWVDANNGKIERRVSFLDNASVRYRDGASWSTKKETLPPAKKKRAIIQQSNVVAGEHHYFRSYTEPYLGRVNIATSKVEYLQLPVQLKRELGNPEDVLLWDDSGMSTNVIEELIKNAKKRPKRLPINQWSFVPNEMKNSRGHAVMGDARSRGTGWGHHASQVPTVIGNRLYIPVMNGTVYVINATAERLDESAIIGIHDLGPVGRSFNRASLSYAGGRLYAHTIRELICIENSKSDDR